MMQHSGSKVVYSSMMVHCSNESDQVVLYSSLYQSSALKGIQGHLPKSLYLNYPYDTMHSGILMTPPHQKGQT